MSTTYGPRWAVIAAIVCLATGAAPLGAAPAGAHENDAECGGIVFYDGDADGNRIGAGVLDDDIDGTEPALVGVEVTVVDAGGATFETASTTDGTWSLHLDPGQYPIRIQFSPPAGHAPSRVGADSGTTVQFVSEPGDCGTGTNGNLGLYAVDGYCADQPELVTSCYVVGSADGHDDMTAILGLSSAATDNAASDADGPADWMEPLYRPIATVGDVGTVYGQAVDGNGTVYAASFVKRHARSTSRLNPEGNPTVIYRIREDESPEVLTVIDPEAQNPHGVIDDPDGYRDDLLAMDAVYTAGLGDLELSPDGSMLYVVDLGRRDLVAVDVADGSIVSRTPIDGPALGLGDCGVTTSDRFGDLRAFGLGWGPDDELLVGVVCSAESTVEIDDFPVRDVAPPGEPAGDPTQLVGYVYDYSDLGFRQRLAWPLAASRGITQSNGLISNDAAWHPWVPFYPFDRDHDAVSYPQPAVTDIAIDADGLMIVALGDRWGHQTAPDSAIPSWDGENRGVTETVSAGDIQRACPADDGWVIEGSVGCAGGFGDGVEFFRGEYFGWHGETALGSVAQIPGRSSIVASQMNPIPDDDAWRSGGIAWHDNASGDWVKGVRLYDGRNAAPEYTFEKASGIGDIAVRCGGAPVQLGGVIWRDADASGRQDPAEQPIAGVDVEIRNADGQVIGSTTTDAIGVYLFDEGNVDGGLTAGQTYVATVARSNFEDGVLSPDGPHTGLRPTVPYAIADPDLDSDAVIGEHGTPFSGLATVLMVAGDDSSTPEREGSVDHSFDIGLVDQYDLAITTTPVDLGTETGLLTYDIVVRNQGSEPSGALVITDRVPDGTSFVRASHGGTAGSPGTGLVTWSIPVEESLEPGESRSLELVVEIDDIGLSPFVNAVEVSDDSGDDDDSVPDDVIIGPHADPLVERLAADESAVDDNLSKPDEDDHDIATTSVHRVAGALWLDEDASGTFDVGPGEDAEVSVGARVVVRLMDLHDNEIAVTETDRNGSYVFPYVRDGTYLIEIPSSQFGVDGPLDGRSRATGPGAPERRADADEHGVRSRVFELGPDGPIGDRPPDESIAPEPGSGVTIDMGFSNVRHTSLTRVLAMAVVGPLSVVSIASLLVMLRRKVVDERALDPNVGMA